MLKIPGRKTSSNVQKVLWCCDEIPLYRFPIEPRPVLRSLKAWYERLCARSAYQRNIASY
jgi:hypothetical protein